MSPWRSSNHVLAIRSRCMIASFPREPRVGKEAVPGGAAGPPPRISGFRIFGPRRRRHPDLLDRRVVLVLRADAAPLAEIERGAALRVSTQLRLLIQIFYHS